MQVLKFGGSSVANATNMSRVLDIVGTAAKNGKVILVSSAIKGCTDTLLEKGLTEDLRTKHYEIVRRLFTGAERNRVITALDRFFTELEDGPETIEAYGELLSTTILAAKLSCDGYKTLWLDSRELIRVDAEGKVIEDISRKNVQKALADYPGIDIYVAPGFIASDLEGHTRTLGRGGSDYSAALYAAYSGADDLQIWTDVPGMMTANPKDVPGAKTISLLSYEAALQLAERGAKVLYAPTVKPAMDSGIPFKIMNSFAPDGAFTLVSKLPESKSVLWRGVTSTSDGEDSAIYLVGEGEINPEASLARMLSCLKENGIRVHESGSEENGKVLFVKVSGAETKSTLATLHAEFFEQRRFQQTCVFVAGHGAVGKALQEILVKGSDTVAKRTGRILRVCGISNSRYYNLDLKGVESLEGGKSVEGWNYIEAVKAVAPRGSVFVDCTNSETIGSEYVGLLESGISVVSSNRRALSGPYSQFASMKNAAAENGVMFKYDTTVGTALPILESISSSANSCDRIQSIEAVVSCTMNYVISSYEGKESLATILKRAQAAGLTEKDPRTDLAGKDALRKLLILGREAGIPLEADDVCVVPKLPEEFFQNEVDDFYSKLEAAEPGLAEHEANLEKNGLRERFVASIVRDETSALGYKAEIRMQECDENSPFYNINGTENVTAIRSDYIEYPLVLKGSGEGAKLAASGIINDILSN